MGKEAEQIAEERKAKVVRKMYGQVREFLNGTYAWTLRNSA